MNIILDNILMSFFKWVMPTFFHSCLRKILEVKVISKSVDKKFDNLVNEDIEFENVLVISETGEQLGVMSRVDALNVADERGYDLVCVAPNAPTPVCKLMDYSKYRYDQLKKAKEAKKNQKIIETKEIRLSPTIDVGDFNTKQKAARKFLQDGNKVKVSCRFRGRMIDHAENTKPLFAKFAEGLADVGKVDQEAYLDGRNMFMAMSPITDKKKK
jgi:translation initiation factor IF-3